MAQQWWTEAKHYINEIADGLGHTLTWKRQPRPSKEHALVFEGTCTDCGATVRITRYASTTTGVRDARSSICTGPGTAILTEIEQERAAEETAELVGEYLQALADAGITYERPKQPFRNPLAPGGECGLMSRDGYTCTRRLNKRGTHNLREWSGPNHVGTHPDARSTAPFTDDDLLMA
ncbi:hypothetical protein [Streptomyces sp. NPDC059786]|uniref:hypothetical protein n=1 Tax=Streptomyces sp. NPDC059786 TaxID=3346946 RepID=UPI0036627472